MEHMKHTHKDPNASGVASKYQLYEFLYKNDFLVFVEIFFSFFIALIILLLVFF